MSEETEYHQNLPKTWWEYLGGFKESIEVYGWVWRELFNDKSKKCAKYMAIVLVFNLTALMSVPWFVGRILDGLASRNLTLVASCLVGCFVLRAISQFLMKVQFSYREIAIGESMSAVDRRTNELFFEKSLGQHLRENGRLSSANVEKGRNRVFELASLLLFEGVETILTISLAFILLCILSPVAGLIVTFTFLVYVAWAIFLNQKVIETITPIDKDFRALNRHRIERWEKVERVKTFGKEKEEIVQMQKWFDRVLEPDRKFWLWFIKQISWRGFVNVFAEVSVLAYGSYLVWQGVWEAGILMPLYSWSRNIMENIWRLANIEHRLNWNLPSVASMKKALTIDPDILVKPDAVDVSTAHGVGVVLDGVTHTYLGHDRSDGQKSDPRSVLKKVSFTVEPGETVALLGKSGAGKTTIMRLLQRGMDPESGHISVNGVDLRDINLSAWLGAIGYVPQQPAVLDGTIRYNLSYGLSSEERENITDEEMWKIVKLLKIDFDGRLTDGLETKVGRNGVRLSGGEAQRLMIGAAAIKHPRFMIIDEATSSLDPTTEKAVQEGLGKVLGGGMSALIITHRLSTVRNICSKFVVLRSTSDLTNGTPQVEAVASSFEELYKISPTFRQLAEDQGIVLS